MIVGSLSGIPYAHYLVRMLPLGLLLLGLHIGVVLLLFRRELAVPLFCGDDPGDAPRDPRLRAIALVCLGGTGLGFLLGGHLAWTALIGATALLVVGPARDPRTAFADVDGRLLLFFAMLFVVVGGLKASGVTEAAFDRVARSSPATGRRAPASSPSSPSSAPTWSRTCPSWRCAAPGSRASPTPSWPGCSSPSPRPWPGT